MDRRRRTIGVFCLIAGLMAVTGSGATESSLAPPTWWSYYVGAGTGTWGRTDATAHSGRYSAFLQGVSYEPDNFLNIGLMAGESNGYKGPDAYAATPGATYTFSFWMKGDFKRVGVRILAWSTEAALGGDRLRVNPLEDSWVVPPSDWTRYEGTFVMPNEAKKFVLFFGAYGDTTQESLGMLYVDDVRVDMGSGNIIQNPGAEDPSELPVSGETYYVSLKGDDANDGTSEATAFRTIQKGVRVARAGDTVIIKAGDYGDEQVALARSGREGAPITIKAERPGEVVLRGKGKGKGLRIVDKSYVVVEGLKFTRYAAGVYIRRSSYVAVRKSIFLNNENAGIVLNDGNPGELKTSHHHLFTENQFLDYAESGQGSPLSGAGTQDYGLRMYFSSNVEVVNNYFYGHHHQALSFKEIVIDSRAADNVFEGAYYTGIYLGQNEDADVGYVARSRNLVAEGNSFRPTAEYRLKSPIRVANVTGAIVRNNFIESPNGYSGQGIAVDESAREVKIYGNVIVNTAESRDNPGIRISADCEVYNNTFSNLYSGLELEKKVRVVVKNNIFYKTTRPIKLYFYKDAENCVFEHNDWFPDWSKKGASDISVDPMFVGPFVPLGLNPYNPGAGGKGDLSGRPTPSGPITLTSYEPKFVPNFERMYAYRLAKQSPCIDQGVDVGLAFVGAAPDLGAFEFESEVGVEEGKASESVPRFYALYPNRPNPFNPDTEIGYALPAPGPVYLAVYDLLGRKVVTLVDGKQEAGVHRVRWDGRDGSGLEVGSGLYLYRMQTDGYVRARKMVRVK